MRALILLGIVLTNFDGVSVSADGGATWQWVQSLATVETGWESFSILLDSYVFVPFRGNTFGADFRVRFSEYDNASAPLDGISLERLITRRISSRSTGNPWTESRSRRSRR